ncbi:hypothetical protein H5410_059715 [Solanum commersonii]|uniref:Uncharacterized protein n=1 Tax=Solanum commersonii TaxID=4109 RepID=A0A9J5W365_SOLCO|nr:hypothetical protein H5410_059715 [Solanum commersonii]
MDSHVVASDLEALKRLEVEVVELVCSTEVIELESQWFGLGTSMLEVSSSKPIASESKGLLLGQARRTGLA